MTKCLSYNMREPEKHYAKWKKPDTEYDSLWFHLYNISRKSKILGERNQIGSCPGLVWEQRVTVKGHRELLGGDGSVLNGTAMIAQLYKFTEVHYTEQLKWVNFMVCKLHLNKTLKNTYLG